MVRVIDQGLLTLPGHLEDQPVEDLAALSLLAANIFI